LGLGGFAILSLFGFSLSAGGGFYGPIPIFLIIGLLIDCYLGIEPAAQPWEEPDESESFLVQTDD
jgi:hypothetical protein